MKGYFKLFIALNAVGLALIAAWLLVPGRLIRPAPVVRSVEMKLVPIDPPSSYTARLQSRTDYRSAPAIDDASKDPAAPRWQILPDGSIRFSD